MGGNYRPRPEKDQNVIFRFFCFTQLKSIPKGQTYPKMGANGVDLVTQIQIGESFRRYCTNQGFSRLFYRFEPLSQKNTNLPLDADIIVVKG